MDRDAARAALVSRIVDGTGTSEPTLRRAAFDGRLDAVPEALRPLVTRMRDEAHAITDAEVAALRPSFSDDVLFEVMLATAFGAAEQTRAAGLAVLEDD
jgi:hypothetical protein